MAKPPAWATAGAVRRRSGRISSKRRMVRLLVSSCTTYHRTSWRSITPQPSRSGPGVRQRAGEAAERLLVVRGEHEQALAAGAGRDGVAAQVADRGQVGGERERFDVVRRAVDPDRALGGLAPVVHAVDQVPRDARAGLRHPDAGRPAPGRAARVVAGRVVDEAEALERPAEHGPADRDPALLARPDVLRPVRRDHLDARVLLEAQLERRARGRAPAPSAPRRRGGGCARAAARRPRPPTTSPARRRCGRAPRTASRPPRTRRPSASA